MAQQPSGANGQQHFQVNCSLRDGSRDIVKEGFTNFTNEEDHASVLTPLSVRATYDGDAIPYFHRMRSLTHPSFSKPLFLNHDHSGRIYSVYERPPNPKVFSQWLESVVEPWEFGPTTKFLLGVGPEIQRVFRQIGSGMIALLDRGEFHGNLKHGMRISADGEVKLCNLHVFEGGLSTNDFEIGLKQDIKVFRELVEEIEYQHPLTEIPNATPFSSFGLLTDLCDVAQTLAGKQLRELAFFIYNNAVFFEDDRCVSLISKLWDYAGDNPLYGTLFNFKSGKVSMDNWQSRFLDVEHNSRFFPLQMLYEADSDRYNEDDGVYHFHRYAIPNLTYYVSGCHSDYSYALLKEAIDGFPPVLFYLAATSLRAVQASFGKDLVDFLRKGRDSIAF